MNDDVGVESECGEVVDDLKSELVDRLMVSETSTYKRVAIIALYHIEPNT